VGIERDLGAEAVVGVGMPGTIGPSGLVKNANSVWLNGRRLADDLARVLPRAACASRTTPTASRLSRRSTGPRPGAAVVFGVIIGTGTGGGVAISGARLGRPQRRRRRMGPQPAALAPRRRAAGSACYCGLSGCLETFLSGPGLAQDHARVTGARATAAEIADQATAGDAAAAARSSGSATGWPAASRTVVNLLDPRGHRAGGRALADRDPLRARARAAAALRFLGHGRHGRCARPSTATPPACAAPARLWSPEEVR
jgi:fructokinase